METADLYAQLTKHILIDLGGPLHLYILTEAPT